MSSDPFGNNPYQSPTGVPSWGIDTRAAALAKVQAPAISLIIVSAISVVVRVVMLVLSLFGVGMVAAAGNQQDQAFAAGQMVGGLVGSVVCLLINGLTIFGALKMRSLEQYGLAMTAAVLAVIPCCSPCVVLGIPFGIWALVVLNDAEVKSAFR